jgi:hypothetical protein
MVEILWQSGVAVALSEKRLLAKDVPGGVLRVVRKPLGAGAPVGRPNGTVERNVQPPSSFYTKLLTR